MNYCTIINNDYFKLETDTVEIPNKDAIKAIDYRWYVGGSNIVVKTFNDTIYTLEIAVVTIIYGPWNFFKVGDRVQVSYNLETVSNVVEFTCIKVDDKLRISITIGDKDVI